MWFLHIESFCAFQPLFFEDLMFKFAKDNCLRPVASPAGTDDPWSGVGYIRKANNRPTPLSTQTFNLYPALQLCLGLLCLLMLMLLCTDDPRPEPERAKGRKADRTWSPTPISTFYPPAPGQHSTHPPHLGQTKPWRRALRWLRGLNLSPPPDRYTLKQPPAGYRDKSKLFDRIQRAQWGWLRGLWGCVATSSRRG